MQDWQRGITGQVRPRSKKRCSRIGINDRAVTAPALPLLQLALAAGRAGAAARAAQEPAETEQSTEPTAAAESEIETTKARLDPVSRARRERLGREKRP